MKKILVVLAALFLSGCSGALGGGASYRVDYTFPDGRTIHATADSVQGADSVEFMLTGDIATGTITGLTFKKTAVTQGQWGNDILKAAIDKIPAVK